MTSYNGTPDIMTASGRFFEFLDPKLSQITIEDIAHALSHACRFAGHCREFYSVAEHSVRVSWICPPEDALWGLLHDASEAYLTDIPRPIKRLLPTYKEMEQRVQGVIVHKFGLDPHEPPSVKQADNILLATEARDLCAPGWDYWAVADQLLQDRIDPWSPKEAKARFLDRFEELTLEVARTESPAFEP